MLDSILSATDGGIVMQEILLCTAVSLGLGIVIALVYMFRNSYNKGFVITLALLPALVQSVILLVNGNLGVGVAVMGAFSLVRFRSVPGNARDISCIFFAMGIGLATGMGYLTYAGIFTVVLAVAMVIYSSLRFGEKGPEAKSLRVTIPEDVDYTGLFDDLFDRYTKRAELDRVRTTNLGSLFELQYTITLRDKKQEKELIDEIRKRNGNLSITCGRLAVVRDEL